MELKRTKKILSIVTTILFAIIIVFLLWTKQTYKPNFNVEDFIKSNENVTIKIDKNIVIYPNYKKVEKGFIFYPGGKVDPKAYIPIATKISEEGYKVVITPMPLNLAIFNKNKADKVIKENNDIGIWVIGGHSLGGVMAADYAYNHVDKIRGLVLLASYPQDKNNLNGKNIRVLSLWGSEDKVANLDKVKSAEAILPSDSVFYRIDGGNHGQFGSYGKQKGDGDAKITEEEQQNISAEYIARLIETIK